MPNTQPIPATDSARELHDLIGDDSTATFENDPKFTDIDGTAEASSENLQDPADREAVQARAKSTDDTEDDDLEDEDDEDLDDEDEEDLDEEDEDDDLDDEDEDEDDEDDDEEYEDDDEDVDDEDEDDDADEVKASASDAPTLRADGLLGYEDEAEDVEKNRDRRDGDYDREVAADTLYRKDGNDDVPTEEEPLETGEDTIRPVHEVPETAQRLSGAVAGRLHAQAVGNAVAAMACQ